MTSTRSAQYWFTTIRRPLNIVLVVSGLLLIGSYAYYQTTPFYNPTFTCPSPEIVERKVGYPHPVKQSSLTGEPFSPSVRDMEQFCSRMKEHFRQTNLIVREARHIYSLLISANGKELPSGNQLSLHNGSYGMPGSERPRKFIVTRQVMLKRIAADEYEFFYYDIGCGINYSYEQIRLKNDEIVQLTSVERWSESFPC